MSDFYVDEDVDQPLVDILTSKGHNLETTRDASNTGQIDLEQLNYAHENNMPIITNNKIDFLRLHQSEQEHSGIFSVSCNMTNEQAAARANDAISIFPDMSNRLVRVNKGEMIIERHGAERETRLYSPEIRKQEYLDRMALEREIETPPKDIERC